MNIQLDVVIESQRKFNENNINKLGVIYMIEIEGNKYIGQTRNLYNRLSGYKNDKREQFKGKNINKNNFKILDIIIYNPLQMEETELDILEKYYIKKYNTYNNGLNKSIGGNEKLNFKYERTR